MRRAWPFFSSNRHTYFSFTQCPHCWWKIAAKQRSKFAIPSLITHSSKLHELQELQGEQEQELQREQEQELHGEQEQELQGDQEQELQSEQEQELHGEQEQQLQGDQEQELQSE